MKPNILLNMKNIYNVISVSTLKDLYVLEASYRRVQPAISKQPMAKPYFAFHLFLRGSGTLQTPLRTYELHSNDIWVRFPGERDTYFDNVADPWSYVYITFMGTQAGQMLKRLDITQDNRIFRSTERLNQLFTEIVINCKKNPMCKDILANAYLQMILGEFAVIHSKSITSRVRTQEDYIQKALNYIDVHFSSDALCAEEIAAYFNLNTDYFLRLFKSGVNIPFSNYLISKRLNTAITMIENDEESSVKTIAEAVGYADPSYFTFAFRKAFGVTPAKYIRQCHARSLKDNKEDSD